MDTGAKGGNRMLKDLVKANRSYRGYDESRCVTKEELLAEKKDIVLDFAMKKQFAVIVDSNPIEYSAFQIEGDAVMADMLLDEDESAVVQDGRIRFVRSV